MVTLEEQGLRDGLQSIPETFALEEKLALIDRLLAAGVRRLQVCSFVDPKRVPQMADAEELCKRLPPRGDVVFSGLVLNEKGVERAIDSGLRHVAVSLSASDTHSRKNTRMGLADARERHRAMVRTAKAAGLRVRGGIQCAFGCRYEGSIASGDVLALLEEQLESGADEIALADSTGMGHPRGVRELVTSALALLGGRTLVLHLHDTEGKALVNLLTALELGVHTFDTAFGGLGGCPYIPNAAGNLATEDVAAVLHQLGDSTGIAVDEVAQVSREVSARLGRELPGKFYKVLGTPSLQVVR